MAIPTIELPPNGVSDVTGTVSGSFTPSGLRNGGLITVVTVNQTTWTALPAAALANRNTLCIQNRSGQQIKINYSSGVVGYVGIAIDDGAERFYDITDDIILYCKSMASSCSVTVEEIA